MVTGSGDSLVVKAKVGKMGLTQVRVAILDGQGVERDGLLPMVGILWIDLAESQCLVGQRKMSRAATGNGNMSKVTPGLWQCYLITSQNSNTAVAGSMVVVAGSSY